MPREKKNKIRKDKRYCRKYHGIAFYSRISDEDAKAKRDEYKQQEQAGFIRQMTVEGYAIPWLKRAYPTGADISYVKLAIHLQHLIDAIGKKKMSEVKPSDIKEIYSGHYKNLSNSYIRAAKQLYCLLFDSAVADGICRSNPARDKTSKPHKGKKVKERKLTDKERWYVEHLCTDHRTYPAVMTMLYAGIRPQEMKALNIDRDVDFEKDTITIRETAHINGQAYEYTEEGKTEYSNRVIPLFKPLKDALKDKHGYLITSAHGERVTIQTWKTAWESYLFNMETAINGIQKRWYGKTKEQKKLADEGKLPAWIEFDIVPYSLRHAFCRFCRDSGVELNTCRKWMGHADTKMILKVYDEVSEDRSEENRKLVEKRLIGVQNGVQSQNGSAETLEK